jgi:hypothetical protein
METHQSLPLCSFPGDTLLTSVERPCSMLGKPQGVAQHSTAMQLLIVTLVRVVMCTGVEAWQHHVVQAGVSLGLQARAQVLQPGHCNVPAQTVARHMQRFCDGFGCNVADGWVVAGSGYDWLAVADFAGRVFARCALHLLKVDYVCCAHWGGCPCMVCCGLVGSCLSLSCARAAVCTMVNTARPVQVLLRYCWVDEAWCAACHLEVQDAHVVLAFFASRRCDEKWFASDHHRQKAAVFASFKGPCWYWQCCRATHATGS